MILRQQTSSLRLCLSHSIALFIPRYLTIRTLQFHFPNNPLTKVLLKLQTKLGECGNNFGGWRQLASNQQSGVQR